MGKTLRETPISIGIESFYGDYVIQIFRNFDFPVCDLLIVDKNLQELYPVFNSENIFKLPISEESKDLSSVIRVLEEFQNRSLGRNCVVGFVGGGVLQDVATLASSIYMRGIDWVFFPTTLQAMLDSCVGGKSSINFGNRKNALGNFFPPAKVEISVNFLETLAPHHIASGLLEGLKISIASNLESEFLDLCGDFRSSKISELDFSQIIAFSLKNKKGFVEDDEFDQGRRRLLNFGHTFGHAIESSSGYKISHGMAVGLGMIAAYHLVQELHNGQTGSPRAEEAIARLLSFIDGESKLAVKNLDLDRCVEALAFDKKANKDSYVFILPSRIGLSEVRIPISESTKKIIRNSIEKSIGDVT